MREQSSLMFDPDLEINNAVELQLTMLSEVRLLSTYMNI